MTPYILGKEVALRLFLTSFVAAEFDCSQFMRANIDCPTEIARSVLKRQAEFFHGRLCAQHALQALGIHNPSVPRGCAREPIWPAGLIGSITHNARYAAAVAIWTSPWIGVGIDIESVIDAGTRDAVFASAINPDEEGLISRIGALSPDLCLTLAFSVKESFFKATHRTVGRFFDFDAVSLTAIDNDQKTITLHINQDLCPPLQRGKVLQACFHLIDPETVLTGVLW